MPTGTYSNILGLNGVPFSQQPTDHHWLSRESIGLDGNGNDVKVSPRQYEFKWDFLEDSSFQQINQYYVAQGVTGTVTATLPTWAAGTYGFSNYSGCIVKELEFDNYYMGWYQGVRLLVIRINGT